MTQTDNPGVVVWPPLLLGAVVCAVLLLGWLWPLPISPEPIIFWVGVTLLILGAALNVWGALFMRGAGTNISPLLPATALVTSGSFRFSRNPLYLAGSILLLGLALTLNNLWGMLALIHSLSLCIMGLSYERSAILKKNLERVIGGTVSQFAAISEAMPPNNAINSDSEKRRAFVASLFTAGYGERGASVEHRGVGRTAPADSSFERTPLRGGTRVSLRALRALRPYAGAAQLAPR